MGMKSAVKSMLFGPPGYKPRRIKRGLLRGLRFNIDTASKSQRLLGLDESELNADMRRFASRARSAVDVGANDGWYTLFFAAQPNVEQVFAFEPQDLRELVNSNFALNDPGFAGKLTLIEKRVGNRDDNGWCSLDRCLPELARPVLLKIDIEGGELEALKGARALLDKGDCLLIIETHSEEMERECGAYLRGLGYTTRIVRNSWYRHILSENRQLPHNRWLIASRD